MWWLRGEHVAANWGDVVSKWRRSRVYSGDVVTNWERKWLNGETGMAKGGDMVAKLRRCDD